MSHIRTIAALTLTAAVCAVASTQLIRPAKSLPHLSPSAFTLPPPSAETPESAQRYFDTIHDRDLFAVGPALIMEGDPKNDIPGITLQGTVVTTPAQLSAAFVRSQDEPRPRLYTVGDQLLGSEIVSIDDRRVTLRDANGEEHWLSIADAGVERERTPQTSSTGIRAKEDGHIEVAASLIDDTLADLGALTRQARALVHVDGQGNPTGYRLSAIRRGGLLDKLGVRNGDIIQKVNDRPLTSVADATAALQALRDASSLDLTVQRRGEMTELHYDVVGR